MVLESFKKISAGLPLTKQEGSTSILLLASICDYGCLSKEWFKYYPDQDFKFLFWGFTQGKGYVIIDWDVYKQITKLEFENWLKTKAKNQCLARFYAEEKKANKFYDKYNLQYLAKLDKEKLAKLIIAMTKLCGYLIRDTVFSEAMDHDLAQKLYLQVGGALADFNVFFAKSTLLTFDSFEFRRNNFLLKERNLIQASKIDYYKYQWLETDYFSAKDLNFIKSKLEKINYTKLEQEIFANDQAIKHNLEIYEDFVKNLNVDLKNLSQFMQKIMFIRDYRKDAIAKAHTIICNSAGEYFKQLGLDPQDCVYAYQNDFIENITSNPDYKEIIAKRKKGCVLLSLTKVRDNFLWEYGDYEKFRAKAMAIMDESVKLQHEDLLKGQVANPGQVKGLVKVILNSTDFGKFQEGDILVTSMTRPEFVPLLKKAKAVITDEGGITCHAAIVSRELNIPCIIGTKNATRVLHDGDEVEVDADQGIINIIK